MAFSFKVSVVGAPGVGKTSLIRRFVEGVFDETYLSTMGVVVSRRTVQVGASSVGFMVWDIEGVERSSALHQSYTRGSQAILYVADGTRPKTLATINELSASSKATPTVRAILLNKIDRVSDWALSKSDLDTIEWADQITETSALNGAGVEAAFDYVAQELLQDIRNKQ